jgi:hypothetical protein
MTCAKAGFNFGVLEQPREQTCRCTNTICNLDKVSHHFCPPLTSSSRNCMPLLDDIDPTVNTNVVMPGGEEAYTPHCGVCFGYLFAILNNPVTVVSTTTTTTTTSTTSTSTTITSTTTFTTTTSCSTTTSTAPPSGMFARDLATVLSPEPTPVWSYTFAY